MIDNEAAGDVDAPPDDDKEEGEVRYCDTETDGAKEFVRAAIGCLRSDVIDRLPARELSSLSWHLLQVSRYAEHRAWMLRAEQAREDCPPTEGIMNQCGSWSLYG